MKTSIASAISLFVCGLSMSCGRNADDFQPETIIAMERAALDRWGRGDPQGYLEITAPEVTYFDPMTEKRINGLEAMRTYLSPFAGKIEIDRYEMIGPKLQRHNDVAVLSYNLVNYRKEAGGPETVLSRWNSTKVYARVEGKWKIVHDHWSYIRPELKRSSAE